MVSPLGSKRGLPSDPPDTGSRVYKPTTTTYRPSRITKAKALISITNSNCSSRSNLIENVLNNRHQARQDTWAKKAESQDAGIKVFNFKRQILKASAPQGQSKEDRRVMIRLGPGHEARKAGAFELRQMIKELVSDKSLVSNVWSVPSGIAILASTPAKAASNMQSKAAIKERIGNATVERQEKWMTFVIGPIPKKVRCLDGMQDPMEGLLQEELATVRDYLPIRYMNWSRKSQNDKPFGKYVSACLHTANIRQRQQVLVCNKCHGLHSRRTCARPFKCEIFGANAHTGSCQKPARCLNCRGPLSSTDVSCPVRLRRKDGVFVRPMGSQLQRTQVAGGKPSLRMMQVNVGRSSSAHDIALALANENSIDILLPQEPWIFTDLSIRKSKAHLSRHSHHSLSGIHGPVNARLKPQQETTDLSRDILQITIFKGDHRRAPIWNFYNVSAGADEAYSSLDLILLNPRNSSTHNRGGIIDLVFCMVENARCEVRKDLHTTSDHLTLDTTVRIEKLEKSKGKPRYKDLDNELFLRLLSSSRNAPRLTSAIELKIETSLLIQDIQIALTGACVKIRPQNGDTPWWNSECQRAVLAYRRARRSGTIVLEKKELRDAVRWAKRAYWRSLKEEAEKLSDECSQDPQSRAVFFHRVLLSRKLETNDIPSNSPTVSKRNRPWHSISELKAYKASSQATSTSPGIDEITTRILRISWPIIGECN
ncbi:hypothetical protein EPUL_001479, partial [Erysiphe pulchra]